MQETFAGWVSKFRYNPELHCSRGWKSSKLASFEENADSTHAEDDIVAPFDWADRLILE